MAREPDVIVLGGGGAALAAALTAAEAGAAVRLIEKNPQVGGTTGMSIGSITAAGTPHQRAAGIVDGPDAHFEDLGLFPHAPGTTDNLELRRFLVDDSANTLAWLMSLGLVFHGPSPEPPHRVPRMHNVLPDSRAYIRTFVRHCRRAGVEMLTGRRGVRLLTEGGRVIGVETVQPDGTTERHLATRAVVLASGDYSASPTLREKFLPADFRRVRAMNPGSTGEGHEMAMALGARVLNPALIVGPELRVAPPERPPLMMRLPPVAAVGRLARFALRRLPRALVRPFVTLYMSARLAPSLALLDDGAFLVTRTGAPVDTDPAGAASAVAALDDAVCFFVLDAALARKYGAWPHFLSTAPGIAYAYFDDFVKHRPDVVARADDVDRLAAVAGFDRDTFRHAAETRRRAGPGFTEPPFYALGPVPLWMMTTEGGLAVSSDLEILDGSGAPIPGLFAAGSTGQGGLQIPGHGHHLGWAFTSGRRAGRNAAAAPRHDAFASA